MDEIYIPPDSQKRLLEISRQTLENFVARARRQPPTVEDPYLLASKYGAFVSLHKTGELRGCIGTCFPTHPLYETVIEMTELAASRDPRVSPIISTELHDIHIDISVVSPLQAAHNPASLQIGRHGLHIASGEKRGVLLPQVAAQYVWDVETFLTQTCLKAGLPGEAWKRPETEVSSFTALVIREER